MDPYDFVDAVNITNQIPQSFYTQIESKKWSDRKEALEVLEKVTAVAKIDFKSDFSELIRTLKKVIGKDANIVVATLAAKCLCQLAKGLRTNFSPYASSCLPILFEKFKEKKPNVVSVLRETTDAVFIGTNLEYILEDLVTFLDSKNPQIKAEISLFLTRVFSHHPQQVVNKKTLRPLITTLIKSLSDMDPTVRDNAAMAIGTAMKVSGEKLMSTFIADVEPIKMSKIKEYFEKAEIFTAPVNGPVDVVVREVSENEPVPQTNGDQDDEEDDEDRIYDLMDAIDITNQIPQSFYTQIESKKWSDRKEALEVLEKVTALAKIKNSDFNELVRVLKKAVSKDANIVVATLAAKCLCQLAKGLRADFSPYASSCLPILFEKFKEKKPNVVSVLREATDAVFIGTNIEYMLEDITTFLDNKNPQIKAEVSLFLSRVFARHPEQVMNKKTLRPLITTLIKSLSDMDPTVRDNAAMAIGTAMKVSGESLMMPIIADVEPIKISKIKEYYEKAQVKKLPKSAITNSAAPQGPQPIQNGPPQPRKSTATMVRSTSNRRLTTGSTKVSAPRPSSVSNSSATVKRNATIIKRSTAAKRPMAPPPQQQQQVQQQQQQQQPAPAIQPQHNSMGPPQPPVSNPISTPAKPIYATTHATSKLHKHGLIDSIILKLIFDNTDEVMDALTELYETLSNDTEKDYEHRINQILDLCCLQLVKSYECLKLSDDIPATQRIQGIYDLLRKIFARQQIISAASTQSIRFLLIQLFTLTQSCISINDDGTVRKTLNNLTVALMDSFEPTNIMCILSGLLNEPSPSSIVEPVKDAIIRSMRSFK